VSAVVRSLGLASALLAIAQGGWEANPRLVQLETARQKGVFNYEESRVGSVELPDPLTTATGRVGDPKSWAARRTEIRDLFREHVYGHTPGTPDKLAFEVLERNERAMDGASTLERIAIVSTRQDRTHRFELTVFLPNASSSGSAPRRVPVLMLLNNRPATNTDPSRKEKSGFWPAEQVIARGVGIAALQVGELAPDDKDRFRDGVIRLFEGTSEGSRPGNVWAGLAAWGWGASRAMDYFATHPRVDAARVGVVGHSRGGKAALWAGTEDERFALVISNESGEGGAALTRRNFGETLARITESFPHWFAGNYRSYAERITSLPVDQHMLLSLIAPRALYVASADEDLWSDPRGEFLSLAHSSPVFALWGDRAIEPGAMPALERPMISGRRGYHIRRGPHNLTPYDWDRFVDFAETLWK
jgi:(4-O-methyl)-D-glucuronate---lignin esterase